MADFIELTPKRVLTGRLDLGSDLLEELSDLCIEQNIRLGQIRAIGAVQQARLGFYDQATHQYRFEQFDRPLELVQLIGNISLKDGQPFVHAHITLSDEDGSAIGGHLAEGTVVFACEFCIEVFDGPALERTFDEQTGLGLWAL